MPDKGKILFNIEEVRLSFWPKFFIYHAEKNQYLNVQVYYAKSSHYSEESMQIRKLYRFHFLNNI